MTALLSRHLPWRRGLLVPGLALMAAGIVCCIRARLGITPISCPPYVLSLGLPPTVGQFTIAMHLVLIAGERILLGRRFAHRWLPQLALALVFGLLIDGGMWLTAWLRPATYAGCLLLLLAGNVMMAAGVCLEMGARAVALPTDGFVQAVSQQTGRPFARIKTLFDISLLLVSIVCSLALLGRIEGVREGTFASALLVGVLVGLMHRMYGRMRRKRCLPHR